MMNGKGKGASGSKGRKNSAMERQKKQGMANRSMSMSERPGRTSQPRPAAGRMMGRRKTS